MADLILADESSSQSSLPTEYYDIVLSIGERHYVASGNRDLQVGNIVYKANPAQRSELRPPQVEGNEPDPFTLALPAYHRVVQRWFEMASPPSSVVVTCWRKQARSGLAERVWIGEVTGITTEDSDDGVIAKLAIPSRTMERLEHVLPRFVADGGCTNDLFDGDCKVDRATFQVGPIATILVDGRTVRVDMGAGHGADWSETGELFHVATGERMTIVSQTNINPSSSTVADLVLELPIPELKTGDQVIIFAGCKKSVEICKQKFANKDNFGGFPDLPTRNPWVLGSFGTGEM